MCGVLGVVYVFHVCNTGVYPTHALYFYACDTGVWCRIYTCITCVKHMYCRCYTHVLEVYELHHTCIAYVYNRCNKKSTFSSVVRKRIEQRQQNKL